MSPEDLTTEDSFETDQNYVGDCERDPLLGGHAPPKNKFRLKTIAKVLLLVSFIVFVIVLVAVSETGRKQCGSYQCTTRRNE